MLWMRSLLQITPWLGRALLLVVAQGAGMLQGPFWRPWVPLAEQLVCTVHLISDHSSDSGSMNTLCSSAWQETPRPLYEGWWCSKEEPWLSFLPIVVGKWGGHPVPLQTSTNTVVFLINKLAACSFPVQPYDHSLLWPILPLYLCYFTSRWDMPWSRSPQIDPHGPHDQKSFKEAFGNMPHFLVSSAVYSCNHNTRWECKWFCGYM